MKKKHRDIVVNGQTYGWIVKRHMGWGERPFKTLRIFRNKKVISKTEFRDEEITPKTVKAIIENL